MAKGAVTPKERVRRSPGAMTLDGCNDDSVAGRLLEREAELGVIAASLDEAATGRGSVILISGEAGIGKTSVVRAAARDASGQARVLVGACDDLGTPRTFGPFRDLA